MRARIPATLACVLFISLTAWSQSPQFRSLSPDGTVVWTNPVPGNLAVFERTTNLSGGVWEPFFFDWGTNGLLTTRLPQAASGASTFYRVGVRTNLPDPSLVMHLSFDNDFPDGTVLDLSGYGNHGRRYGRPGFPTNWPSITLGPDGSRAAEFRWYADNYGLYGKTGDYIGIPVTTNFTSLPQATISIWAWYYTSFDNNIVYDHNSTLMNSGHIFPGTFFFGRNYANYTSFTVTVSSDSAQEPIIFPDASPIGNSGGWHHYVITFDAGFVKGYFDGKLIGTGNVTPTALAAAGQYIGMSCWTFNATPELDLSVDGHPNNAWINGAVDDVRIYRRVLNDSEVSALYRSFDKLPPSVPSGLVAAATASSQVRLQWSSSTDVFGVSGYVLRRNGSIIANTTNRVYFDGVMAPQSTNSYTVQALDSAGNYSAESTPVVAVTLPSGSVNLIIDDADGQPWFVQDGSWFLVSDNSIPGFWPTSYLSDGRLGKGKSLTYTPPIPETGTYSIFMRYPGSSGTAFVMETAVPVDIVRDGITNSITVNQRLDYGTWKFLGQFSLTEGTNSYVRLRTDGTSGYVFGDAFMFVK